MGVTIGAAMHAAIPLVQDLESLQIRDSWQVTAVEDWSVGKTVLPIGHNVGMFPNIGKFQAKKSIQG